MGTLKRVFYSDPVYIVSRDVWFVIWRLRGQVRVKIRGELYTEEKDKQFV